MISPIAHGLSELYNNSGHISTRSFRFGSRLTQAVRVRFKVNIYLKAVNITYVENYVENVQNRCNQVNLRIMKLYILVMEYSFMNEF